MNPTPTMRCPAAPSPYHGYQEAFGLDSTYGDIEGAIRNLATYLDEHDAVGPLLRWSIPVNMSMINASYEYACAWAEGKLEEQD